MDMHGNDDRSPKESGGSKDILGKNKLVAGVETCGDGGDTPESSSKKPKLTNDSTEEERPSVPPLSEMEQPKRVDTLPELMGSSHPSQDVSNQVSRQFGDSTGVGTSQGQGSGEDWVVVRDIQPSQEPPERKDKKGLNLVQIDGWPLGGPELGLRMLDEMSTNFLQPSQSSITQNEQKFLVELDAGGFSFDEVTCYSININITFYYWSSISQNFLSCDFSTDGNFLACAGHGKKVTVWNKEESNFATTVESHSNVITEVRFRSGSGPRSTIYATSSLDRSVRICDAARPDIGVTCTLKCNNRRSVLSLDFHPTDCDLLCMCKDHDMIQIWNIENLHWMHTFRGGTRQVKFQPPYGKLLATASEKFINIFRTGTYKFRNKLQGHSRDVLSICWHQTGNFIAYMSEDEARFWSAASKGGLLHVLACKHGKFESCIFHPGYPNLLIISGHEYLEFWIPESGYTLDFLHNDGIITGLATSPQNQMVASTVIA